MLSHVFYGLKAAEIGISGISEIFAKKGIAIEELYFRLGASQAEFDLAALNGKELVLAGIKTRLKASDIHNFIHKQIPNFKEYFGKRYNKGRRITGALAGLVVDAELEKQVEEAGLIGE